MITSVQFFNCILAAFLVLTNGFGNRDAFRPLNPKTALCQNAKDDVDQSFSGLSWVRRSVLGSFAIAPAIYLPFPAHGESHPDFNCLADLPRLSDDCVRIYFCRHGQTENNRLRKVQGARVDPPINENGQIQAIALGKTLAAAVPTPSAVYCSTLIRARMTAESAVKEIGSNVEIQELASLGEVDFGPVAEGQAVVAALAKMSQTYAAWAMGQIDFRPEGGGETGREVSF